MGGDALRWSEYRSMPWKNGGGVTREVASGAVQAPMASAEIADGFDWRVSVADVDAGGSFSVFPGIDRVITLVEGEGMVLTVDGTPHPVGPLSPFAFSGDAATDCRLEAGAVRNMNVMTRRSRATAQVRIITVAAARGAEMACAAGETLVVMAVTDGITVGGQDGRETRLGRLDCVRHEGPAALTLRGDGKVAGIRISAVR
ncbi:HutD family protein [Streptomyces scabiei]|uniref:HutD family protein n=1 Tax=Streptomyces TaxID=1883 RepID=UPI00298EFC89|nr:MULTISPECIES: HutD family protein [Streptomyces]MDW8471537.1 HutD family protein [Streptomyces scabiei]MDX2567965.1 HutD family protein [Streptomyces scabiei]MDX3148324.1 HutD family protein [Streptomyces scabiei]MDX3156840.1 HutD family protein [Streptomyces scabiei]MDX3256649.1 HutD family protein [Streptomyces scabiei]